MLYKDLEKGLDRIINRNFKDLHEIEKMRLKEELKQVAGMPYSMAMKKVIDDITFLTKELLDKKIVRGISTTVYLTGKQDYYINVMGGHNGKDQAINRDMYFDIDEITQIFTLMLFLKLHQLHLVDLNKPICQLDSNYPIKYTLKELIECNCLGASFLPTDFITSKQQLLQNIIQNLYGNFPNTDSLIIASDIIARKFNRSYSEIVTYIFNLYGIDINKVSNVAGNNRADNQAHNTKVRLYGEMNGQAGIFINGLNLAKLAKSLYRIDKDNSFLPVCYAKKLYNIIERIKPYKLDYKYSNNTIAIKGYNNCLAVFDDAKKIHNSFLYDIKDLRYDVLDTELNSELNSYQNNIMYKTLKLYLMKKYLAPELYDFDIRKNIQIEKQYKKV